MIPRQLLFASKLEILVIPIALSMVVFIPQWRFGYNLGDEGLLWYLSQQVHYGHMSIRDFFGYDPGRYLWSAAWFRVWGSDGLFEQRIANGIFGIVGLTAGYAAMYMASMRHLIRIGTAVLLAIALGFPRHKVYEQAMSLIAVALIAYALYQPDTKQRWLLLGVASGVSAIIGRNSGVYFVIASMLALGIVGVSSSIKAAGRGFISVIAGVILGYLPMVLWFAFDGAFRHAMVMSIAFTSKWQLPLPIPFPWRTTQSVTSVAALQATAVSWLTLATLAGYTLAIAGLVLHIRKRGFSDKTVVLQAACLCAGLPFLHQGFDRADFSHIAQGILPFFILAAAWLNRQRSPWAQAMFGGYAILVLAAWVPNEPIVAAALTARSSPSELVSFPIDGKEFVLNSLEAEVLQSAKKESLRCHASPQQVVTMPYFPGILAYLHATSPYWEMYFLYPRSAVFQRHEIDQMEASGTRLAIINFDAAMDGRDDLRIGKTNSDLVSFIKATFADSRKDISGFSFYERGCR